MNHQLWDHQIDIYWFTYKKLVNKPRSGADLRKRVKEKEGEHLGLLTIFYVLGSISKLTYKAPKAL